jgi:hypothetical protein
MKNLRFFFIVLLGILIAGCSTKELPILSKNRPMPSRPICRVAVLPFFNETKFPYGDAVFSKVFAAELQAASDYFLIQEGDILKAYQQLHILPGMSPNVEKLQIIADRINAQLLITGSIIGMRMQKGKNPSISVEVEIHDGRSGETIWATLHRRDGLYYNAVMHFGTIHTVTGLSKQMAVEIINLWLKKGLQQCTESPRS